MIEERLANSFSISTSDRYLPPPRDSFGSLFGSFCSLWRTWDLKIAVRERIRADIGSKTKNLPNLQALGTRNAPIKTTRCSRADRKLKIACRLRQRERIEGRTVQKRRKKERTKERKKERKSIRRSSFRLCWILDHVMYFWTSFRSLNCTLNVMVTHFGRPGWQSWLSFGGLGK